jgi:hypothetical protein
MRIELYKLVKTPASFDIAACLHGVFTASLQARNRARETDLIRLETLEQRDSLWFCDFVRLRMHHGPAKAGVAAPVEGFDLGRDDGFGEETAFLWDSSNDWCVVQYNHYGVRPNTIAEYLSEFVHDASVHIELAPKIDERIHAKIKAKKIVTKLVLSVAPKELSDTDFDLGAGLGTATKALKQSDADRVEITIATRKQEGLNFNLTSLEQWIRRIGGKREDSPVGTARATAHEEFGGSSEVLDLLHARVTSDAILKPGVDKRYPRADRWNAIQHAHTKWRHLMK